MRFVTFRLFAALVALAPADGARGQTADGPVMEIVTFRLNPGITDTAFLALARATEGPVSAQPGFLRRSLLRNDAGDWTDLVEWQSLAQAQAAAEAVMAEPAFAPFAGAIDMTTLSMRHVPILWQGRGPA
jgi:Antibiotic biosynthesis monooxygenase